MEVERKHFEEIESTHLWAVEHHNELDKRVLTCITAGHQTSGIGRKGSEWVSKPGNLAMTLVFALPKECHAECLAQALTCSARHAMNRGEYKWPNDLLIDGKKVGGAMVHLTDGLAIASLGLNVNAPVSTDQPTIALCEVTGTPWDLPQLTEEILTHFQNILPYVLQDGFSFLHAEYETRLAYRGQEVVFKKDGQVIKGTLTGLSPRGELQISTSDGATHTFSSGELLSQN